MRASRTATALVALVAAALASAVPVPAIAGQATDDPGEGVWRNYDFVPGHTVWRATDFAGEPVGRFPASQLEYVRGNLQVVEIDGEPVLEASSNGVFRLHLPEALPESFSLEFLAHTPTRNLGIRVFFGILDGSLSRHESDYLHVHSEPGIYRQGDAVSAIGADIAGRDVPVRLQVDGEYAILYVGSERAAQVPIARFARAPLLEFHLQANANHPAYIRDIVVAVGLDSLYDALMETGEFTTRGILFDTGSARLRPESTPVLDEIHSTLAEHPELRIVIEGHTDAVGDDASNQQLSERRAGAVVEHLVARGIDAGRLGAVGKGEAEPVADNDTAEGRQQNRRVVIRSSPQTEE